VLDVCPDDQAAAYHLGMAYYHSQKIPQATDVFRKALAQDPRDHRLSQMYELLTEVPGI
jgi:Tfp pilus assembly protein PilF